MLRSWANENRAALGLDPDLPITVPSFHPVFRTKDNGRLRVEMVVEIIQSTQVQFSNSGSSGRIFSIPRRGDAHRRGART